MDLPPARLPELRRVLGTRLAGTPGEALHKIGRERNVASWELLRGVRDELRLKLAKAIGQKLGQAPRIGISGVAGLENFLSSWGRSCKRL